MPAGEGVSWCGCVPPLFSLHGDAALNRVTSRRQRCWCPHPNVPHAPHDHTHELSTTKHASDMNMVVTLRPAAITKNRRRYIFAAACWFSKHERSNELLFVVRHISCCPERTSPTGKRSHKNVASKLSIPDMSGKNCLKRNYPRGVPHPYYCG